MLIYRMHQLCLISKIIDHKIKYKLLFFVLMALQTLSIGQGQDSMNLVYTKINFEVDDPKLNEVGNHEKIQNKVEKIIFTSLKSPSPHTKSILDLGGGGSLEYLALMMNLNLAADFYFLNFENVKLSISNRSGFVGGIAPWGLIYTYPSIKYQQNISGYWLTFNLGREYGNFISGNENSYDNYQVDYRIDIGLRIYKSSHHCIEFFVPIRKNAPHTFYSIGIGLNHYYRI